MSLSKHLLTQLNVAGARTVFSVVSSRGQQHLSQPSSAIGIPEAGSPSLSVARHGVASASYEAGSTIEEPGRLSAELRVITAGWAALAVTLPDGRRQIARLLIPGDICGPTDRRGGAGPCATIALTVVKAISRGSLAEALEAENPNRTRLVDLLEDAGRRERTGLMMHVVRLGRMSAYERTGHLLLELLERHTSASLTSGATIPLPLTQEILADTLGLSVVHMNRTLQQLRRDKYIVSRAGRITFLDAERLALTCDYIWEDGPPPRHDRQPSAPPDGKVRGIQLRGR